MQNAKKRRKQTFEGYRYQTWTSLVEILSRYYMLDTERNNHWHQLESNSLWTRKSLSNNAIGQSNSETKKLILFKCLWHFITKALIYLWHFKTKAMQRCERNSRCTFSMEHNYISEIANFSFAIWISDFMMIN